ncbi:MAG: hypothetical protein ACXAC2_13735 [Candidatus Kariarchaeaceae archaeon]|jgi:hypothetical protein
MKVTIHGQSHNEFEPVEITLRIESEDELATLWRALNVSKRVVLENNSKRFTKHTYNMDAVQDVWEALDNVALRRGIDKFS